MLPMKLSSPTQSAAIRGMQEPVESVDGLEVVVTLSLFVSFILLPVQQLELPLNSSLFDLWNCIALPIQWIYVAHNRIPIRFPFIVPIWLILTASVTSMFFTPDHLGSLVLVFKEVYLYVWFLTLVNVLSHLRAKQRRMLMSVWLAVALVNGLVILAQSASADFLRSTTAYVGKYGYMGAPRPLGLFKNPNMAADFQLSAFLPLLLNAMPGWSIVPLALVLLLSIVAAGSMGASIALVAGSLCGLVLYQFGHGRWERVFRLYATIGAILLAVALFAYWLFQTHPDYASSFSKLFYGRLEGSASKRFLLWQSGYELLEGETFLWGVGAGAFKDDTLGVGLHNDLLAFTVERGIFGALGLVLLGGVACAKVLRGIRNSWGNEEQIRNMCVLLGIGVAIAMQSLTHQVFHFRTMWLFLALLEVVLYLQNDSLLPDARLRI